MFDVQEDIRKICENTRKYMKIIRKCTTNAKNAGNNIYAGKPCHLAGDHVLPLLVVCWNKNIRRQAVSPALGGY